MNNSFESCRSRAWRAFKGLSETSIRLTLASIAVLAALFLSTPTFAQVEITKVVASDDDAGDLFGASSAISGDTAVVGTCERLMKSFRADPVRENQPTAQAAMRSFSKSGK